NLERLLLRSSAILEKYYITEKHDIFTELPYKEWGLILYQWGTNWTTFTGKNKQVVNDYELGLLKKDYKKFVLFLNKQVKNNFDLEEDVFGFGIQELSHIYNLGSLIGLAEKYSNEPSLKKEEKRLFTQFINQSENYLKKVPQNKSGFEDLSEGAKQALTDRKK